MKKLIVVSNPKKWKFNVLGIDVVSAKEYLTNSSWTKMKNMRVFNLCNKYDYQSKGYYVSLLAEARGHKVVPHIKNIQDIKAQAIVKMVSDDIDEIIQRVLKKVTADELTPQKEFILSVYFGRNVEKKYLELSQELHRSFKFPFLRAAFIFKKKWFIKSIKLIGLEEIPENHLQYVNAFAAAYFSKKRYLPAKLDSAIYDLAILLNPNDKEPPSNKKAIQKFISAAEDTGFSVEIITQKDYHRISEFDAMFIRDTTNVNHYTYRFARRAQAEGLAVIDDPDSILRCSNKVYLQEIMAAQKIPNPGTVIVHQENKDDLEKLLDFPLVLKLPDSSFSQGVVKVENDAELKSSLKKMFLESDLLIAQKFIPTDFDWRIGVLNGKAIFACKYFMAKDHWQIYNWKSTDKNEVVGRFSTLSIDEVPHGIVKLALKVCSLIGDGLYGVDIKESDGKFVVIEVNDNPNIDAGIEDKVEKDNVYLAIMRFLRSKIEKKNGK